MTKVHSDITTEGIRVEVYPEFAPDESSPSSSVYVFLYKVTITNTGKEAATLISRSWNIINSDGEEKIIEGRGVIGETPRLLPGENFTYESFTEISTPWGTMEGTYQMIRDNGTMFDVEIARFYLVS